MNALLTRAFRFAVFGCFFALLAPDAGAQPPAPLPKAVIDGSGPGWFALTQEHFININCDTNTWTWTNNHYYVRAINGEVRLWVNGEEVSGGSECRPATGYLCLESEGAPIEFRELRIRELP